MRSENRGVIPNVPPAGKAGMRNLSLGEKDSHYIIALIILTGIWFLITAFWSLHPEVSIKRALYFILISIGSVCAGLLSTRLKIKEKRLKQEERRETKDVSREIENENKFLSSKFSLLTSNLLPLTSSLLPANIIVITLCLFSLITGIPSDSWTLGNGKGFAGFFGHQNLLASILLFTMPGVLLKIKEKGKKIKGEAIFYFILLSLNLLVLALTYSRATMFSLAVGIIFYLVLRKHWKIILYGFLLIITSGVIVWSIPSLKNETEKLIYKDFPTFLYTRQWLWGPSYKAALNGGLTGLGYGISDPSIILPKGTGSHYDGDVYEREKGNSTFALIEETGLIGLALFILLIGFTIKIGCMDAAWMHDQNSNSVMQSYNHSFLLSALVAFLVHSQFEAWMTGVGSVQLPLFFFYIGLFVKGSKFKSSKFEG